MTSTHCDICKARIAHKGDAYEITVGVGEPPLDICPPCAHRLGNAIRTHPDCVASFLKEFGKP